MLIYGNKTERDILFRQELANVPANVRVVHVLSDPDENWDSPHGYVTKDVIRQHAGELLPEADVYLCGPPPMMDKVQQALQELSVAVSRMHYEKFSL